MSYYIGIDLGGTNIKGGVADETGNVLCKLSVPTEAEQGARHVAENIVALAKRLVKESGRKESEIKALGAAIPGMIDEKAGVVVYSNNLQWENVPIAKIIEDGTGYPVAIGNDANVAALGEAAFGAAKTVSDSVTVTLGTGVGSGIVIGGKIYGGGGGAGAEIGHTVIHEGGELCTCGRRGCLEAYASATALSRETRRAARENPDSALNRKGVPNEKVSGRDAFFYKDEDAAAHAVVEKYLDDLSAGLVNIANVFRPQMILLGGGVSAQGENLTVPLQKRMDRDIYGGKKGPATKIMIAALGNDAGFLGAVALAAQIEKE